MAWIWTLGILALAALLVLPQLARVFGRIRGALLWLVVVATVGTGWWLLARSAPADAGPADWAMVEFASAAACAKCHPDHHASWQRTYHRSMTRDPTPENVKGDFHNAVYDYQGLRTRFTRAGDDFFMETVDPSWAELRARAAKEAQHLPAPRFVKFRVDRLVGSHWIQECMHREPTGRFIRLPVLFHIGDKRWMHSNGAFLTPDTDDFWAQSRGTAWNDSCLYCHNTGPSKNPIRGERGQVIAYGTEVAELGISCEACHGPGEEHVRLNQNPARRLALQQRSVGDPSIVHPERLSVQRRDEICARCHGALVPNRSAWDARTHRDPFIPGQELARFNHLFWSEAEQARLLGGQRIPKEAHAAEPIDGRFWCDGTPLTTALEYNGLALSACYQRGRGTLSCLTCHTMHGEDPNFQLRPRMQTNDACYQCHGEYRTRLTEHTHHAADSSGSLCYNCHMPHVVYSLLTTHRSHRIESPDVKVSLETGKPHACNLCHLDKSLGWTQTQLAGWSYRLRERVVPLPPEEESNASSLLLLARGDARCRVMIAGALSNPSAQQASGVDWLGSFLTRLLEHERYPAVRYLAHRGLRSIPGEVNGPFDHVQTAAVRSAQLRALRVRFDRTPVRRSMPYLPLTPEGLPDEAVIRSLREQRKDPDLTINE